jgi:hypothetical protein
MPLQSFPAEVLRLQFCPAEVGVNEKPAREVGDWRLSQDVKKKNV